MPDVVLPLFPAVIACFAIATRDIGFHVATGRAIATLGHVPATNVLSFTHPDYPWILHQWIPAYAFYVLDRLGGSAALVAAKSALVYLTFLFLWLALKRILAKDVWGTRYALFVLAASAAAPRFLVRPFLVTMLALSILLWLVARHVTGPHERFTTDWRRFAWLSTALIGVASVMHAGFIYLWLVVGIIGVGLFLQCVSSPTRWSVLKHVALWGMSVAAVSIAALVVAHPHGIDVITLPFQFSSSSYFHDRLIEYRPPAFDLRLHPGLWALLGVTACLALHWVVRIIRRQTQARAETIASMLLACAFGYLVLKHARLAYAFGLVGCVACAVFIADIWRTMTSHPFAAHASRTTPKAMTCHPLRSQTRLLRLGFALVALGIGSHALWRWATLLEPGFGTSSANVPTRLLNWVEAQRDFPARAFVSDAWGGHWLWRFYPKRRSFYDNRLEAYPGSFVRHVYQRIRYGQPGWQRLLEQYQVNAVVLRYSTAGERNRGHGKTLHNAIAKSTDWKRVCWFESGAIYVRRQLMPNLSSLSFFEPDRMTIRAPSAQAAREELAAVESRCGRSNRLQAARTLIDRLAQRL